MFYRFLPKIFLTNLHGPSWPPTNKNLATALGLKQLFFVYYSNGLWIAQSTISKSKPVSSSSEGEDVCDKKMQNPRNYKIREFLENWKMDYLASFIPADRSKPVFYLL